MENQQFRGNNTSPLMQQEKDKKQESKQTSGQQTFGKSNNQELTQQLQQHLKNLQNTNSTSQNQFNNKGLDYFQFEINISGHQQNNLQKEENEDKKSDSNQQQIQQFNQSINQSFSLQSDIDENQVMGKIHLPNINDMYNKIQIEKLQEMQQNRQQIHKSNITSSTPQFNSSSVDARSNQNIKFSWQNNGLSSPTQLNMLEKDPNIQGLQKQVTSNFNFPEEQELIHEDNDDIPSNLEYALNTSNKDNLRGNLYEDSENNYSISRNRANPQYSNYGNGLLRGLPSNLLSYNAIDPNFVNNIRESLSPEPIKALPTNEEYAELVKTIKRARLDSLLGISHNFLMQNEVGSIDQQSLTTENTNTKYKIFDLGNKQFKNCSLQDILNFNIILKTVSTVNRKQSILVDSLNGQQLNEPNMSKQVSSNSALNPSNIHYMIFLTSITEQVLSTIINSYGLNPLLLWEIILKQQYDKVFQIDENTVFYNIEVIEDNQLQKKYIIKIIHLIKRNIMFVVTNQQGHLPFMSLMKKIFKFQSLDHPAKQSSQTHNNKNDNQQQPVFTTHENQSNIYAQKNRWSGDIKLNIVDSGKKIENLPTERVDTLRDARDSDSLIQKQYQEPVYLQQIKLGGLRGHAQSADKEEIKLVQPNLYQKPQENGNFQFSNSNLENNQSADSQQQFEDTYSNASEFVGGGNILQKQQTFGLNQVNEKGVIAQLQCEDILYGVIDDSIRKIEPIILRFEPEAQALNNLSLNLSHNEKLDYVRRSHMAKDMMLWFDNDLQIKQKFFKSLKKKAFISTKMKVSIFSISIVNHLIAAFEIPQRAIEQLSDNNEESQECG
eukprot:403337571